MANKMIERLEKLKQATIINYSSEINYDRKMSLYDVLLCHLFAGDFIDIFDSFFDTVKPLKKNECISLAKKYASLCFYNGKSNYWPDSVDGVYLDDYDLICTKIIDNYDFLLNLSLIIGEDGLKKLISIQKYYLNNCFIDSVRGKFQDDELLCQVLQAMTRKDGGYDDFTDSQKAFLLRFPDGVLFDRIEGGKIIVSPRNLENKMKYYIEKDGIIFDSFSSLENIVFEYGAEYFDNLLLKIYRDSVISNIRFL